MNVYHKFVLTLQVSWFIDSLSLFTETSQESQSHPTLLSNLVSVYSIWAALLPCHHCYQRLPSSTAGSSSFESQKMDRPSISVMSPTSPGALRDLPLVLPGQLSVSVREGRGRSMWLTWMEMDTSLVFVHLFTGETVVWQSGPSVDCQHPSSHRPATSTRRTTSEPLCQDVLPAW